MDKHRARISRSRECGLMTVEFAIAVPLLLGLMLAAAELGRAYYHRNTLTKAVRDGARYLAANVTGGNGLVDPLLLNQSRPIAQNLVVYGIPGGAPDPLLPGFTLGDVTAEPFGDDIHVIVTATYTYTPLLRIPGSTTATPWVMFEAVTMRPL